MLDHQMSNDHVYMNNDYLSKLESFGTVLEKWKMFFRLRRWLFFWLLFFIHV